MSDRTESDLRQNSPKFRVCVLNEFFYPNDEGGTGAVLSALVADLKREHPELDIDVVTSRFFYRSGSNDLPPTDTWNGVRIFRVDSPQARGVSTPKRLVANAAFAHAVFRKLSKLHAQKRYDVILVSSAPPILVGVAQTFRRLFGVPYIYVVYDLDPDRAIALHVLSAKSVASRALKIAQSRWLHTANTAVVLGRCMESYISQEYKLPSSKLLTIPIGADPDSIPVRSVEDAKFRQEKEISGFVLCYSGNFGRYHDFNTILEVAKKFQDTDSDISFVLVGNGAQKAHIESRVQEEGIRNVKIFPFLPLADYPDLLASADASIVTLEPGMEGLCVPSKFYSILSSGRPTVAIMGPKCEVARVVEESRCGVRVEPNDIDSLFDAIQYLIANPEERRAMGDRARKVLESDYSSRIISEKYYEALKAACQNS